MEIIDISASQFRNSPYTCLDTVRQAGPFCMVEPNGFLGVTRYKDVLAVLKNPQVYSSAGLERVFPPLKGAELFTRNSVLLGSDPPSHTRVRRLVQRSFTIKEMAGWEPKIEKLTSALINKLVSKPTFDLINELAMPLPVTVISELLGVDQGMQQDFKRWSDDLVSVRTVQVAPPSEWKDRREKEIVKSCDEFREYFESVIAQRRSDKTGSDLISTMVRASEDDDVLKPDEVLGLARLMLVAGNETTTNLIGNAVTALLNHPSQWRDLVNNPSLADAVIEETLRWDPPVIHVTRRVAQNTELAGMSIAEGTIVAPLLASANRDPEKFEEPDRFDIYRNSREHLAFGAGVHVCIGAALSRMEARIALRQLAEKVSNLALGPGEADRLEALAFRGHRSLPLCRGNVGDTH
ncbi:MAG: cytochrome P450 [Oligoflexales bacterium]